MGKINLANLKKTIYYLKRNGIKNTCYAVGERLAERKLAPYSYVSVSESELAVQRKWAEECVGGGAVNVPGDTLEAIPRDAKPTFSIVVPTYRTNETYLRDMIQSVADQSYPYWELVLADATEDDCVKAAVEKIKTELYGNNAPMPPAKGAEGSVGDLQSGAEKQDVVGRIRYIKLPENAGIAANTNQGLQYATGDYIGLLDHDDVLTPDALYEMAVRILEAEKNGAELQMLYSDEDKCNGDRTSYYERNRKEEFNLDLLLSNNYICHFLVMKSELIKGLAFRPEYDGAQDYDLVLRAAKKLLPENIAYIPRVLYHWRCHTGSTAENPQSKQYAYDAGLRALQDFADSMDYQAKAVHLKHLGFYMLEYPQGILESRKDLGAVGGRILGTMEAVHNGHGKKGMTGVIERTIGAFSGPQVIGGRMSAEGDVYYEGLSAHYSGYLHRAVLTQTAEAVDIRCIRVNEECREIFEKVTGVPYREVPCRYSHAGKAASEAGQIAVTSVGQRCEGVSESFMIFDASILPAGTDCKALSLKLCKALQEAGYAILYHPSLEVTLKGEQR